jgi:Zn-finger protein
MYDHITPTITAYSKVPLEVKKRKSGHEYSEAAQALLSMDVKRLAVSKRIRPSQFSSYDARDLSPERNTSNLEDRDRKDDEIDSGFSYSDSSPILTRRLVGQDELVSALALASLAYSPPKRIEPPRAKVRIVEDTRSYSRDKPLVSPETHYPRYNQGRNNSVVHKYCQYPLDQMPYMPLDRMIHTNQHSTFTRNDAHYLKKWKCDFCHVHVFASYEDALNHEKVCSLNTEKSKMEQKRSFQAQNASIPSQNAEYFTCLAEEDESKYFCGIIPLGIPEADPQWLSEMNCFIRNNCIEAFSANDGKLLIHKILLL